MSFSDLFTVGNTAISSFLGAIVAWLAYKQFRAASPSEIEKRVLELEEKQKDFDKDLERQLLIEEQNRLSLLAIKDTLSKLDNDIGDRLGDVRDEITRMEVRIDNLYNNRK